MLKGVIAHIREQAAGLRAGGRTLFRRLFRGAGEGSVPSRPLSAGTLRTASILAGAAAAVCILAAAALPALAAPVTGDRVTNSATLTTADYPVSRTAVTATIVIRTSAVIEFLTYTPGGTAEYIPRTSYRSGSDPASPFVPLPDPVNTRPEPDAALAVDQTLPLTPTTTFHQGEPLFIRLTDLDQNLDPTVRETVLVTVIDNATGDTEVLRLTETGPNTGVFTGYIQTSGSAGASHNGVLTVAQGNTVVARYTDIVDGEDTSVDSALVDPYGVVFDTVSGLPVNGATVRLLNSDGSVAAGRIFADDGVTPFPYELLTGDDGGFRFPFILPGSYRLQVIPPAGYSATSLDLATLAQRWGALFTIVDPASIGGAFPVNPGPAIRIDIPLDPAPSGLWVMKSAGKSTAAIGDFVPYTVKVQNRDGETAVAGLSIRDALPPGFRYRDGSARVDGLPAAPVIAVDGRTLSFPDISVPAGGDVTISYVLEITAGSPIGKAVNRAGAYRNGSLASNRAEAAVTVRNDFLAERTIIMGQVLSGVCGAPDTAPGKELAGIRIYLEDGTFVDTDKQGMFHFDGVRPGTHVVQLDLDSLPDGFQVVPCEQNSRFAGRAYSQFVNLQGGSIWRADFHIARIASPEAAGDMIAANSGAAAAAGLELSSSVDRGDIAYRIQLSAAAPVQEPVLTVQLPPGTVYRPGSSSIDGVPAADPAVQDATLTFRLPSTSAPWKGTVSFAASPTGEEGDDRVCRATLSFSAGGSSYVTPTAENSFRRTVTRETTPLPDFVIHPRFRTLGIQLSEEDRRELANLARTLKELHVTDIQVTGHTDNVPIARHNRQLYADNVALSWARARSVGSFLMEALGLPPSSLSLAGRGDAEPVADNGTDDGRAKNRRVEIRIRAGKVTTVADTRVVKKESGPQSVSPPAAAAAPVEQAAAPAVQDAKTPAVTEKEGLLSPAPDSVLAGRINTVRICLPVALKPKLLLDGKEIPADRIGFSQKDTVSGKALYSYIGVDFGDPGPHTLRVQGTDPFGNARFDRNTTIVRSGDIATIRVRKGPENIADGKTPVRFSLELLDSSGTVIPATTELEIRNGNLKPPRREGAVDTTANVAAVGAFEHVTVEQDGTVRFQPVAASGSYRVVLGYGTATIELETYAKPVLRDWILVGLAEGTAGYNTVSGHMENLTSGELKEDYYDNGRVAFFAKGKVKGEWLLTASYDSAKYRAATGNSLFQTVDPESTYTLYGDATQQQYDAASSRKLYVKLEREQFYALFGDFDSGLTLTELSRYSRRMNGVKAEYQDRNLEAVVFGSETDQAFVRDELRGDGTSGLYRLSQSAIIANTEKITLEIRDRFHSEVVISSRPLSRFADYTIDYEAGTVFFKEPVPSRDDLFNPVYLVVEYETRSAGGDALTYGGRAGVKLMDQRLRAGVTYIHEGQVSGDGDSYGADATVKLNADTTLRAEAARTETDFGGTAKAGSAYLAELLYRTATTDAKVYFREMDEEFGLGQQKASEAGTRKVGGDAALKLSERLTLTGQLSRQYDLKNGNERDVAEAKVTWAQEYYSAFMGLRRAEDRLAEGDKVSNQLTMGGRWLTLNRRLTLSVSHDQSIGTNDNADFPTRTTFGAELKLTERIAAFAQQEITDGDSARSNSTRVGLKSTPWQGGELSSSVERAIKENEERMFALFGLKQTWRLTDRWSVDGSIDRSQTIRRSYRFSDTAATASGESEDFTALSAGSAYREKDWEVTGRIETRDGESEDKWGITTSVVGEPAPGWGWSARLQIYDTKTTGQEKTSGDLRLGLAYRPRLSALILLDRLDIIREEQKGESLRLNNWRIVNNLAANYRHNSRLQTALFYGAKYVRETINGDDYSGYTDLLGMEQRYDFTKKWDGAVRLSLLHSWNGGQISGQAGLSVGYNVMENAWVSVGYNLAGFRDDDFSRAEYTAQGPYVAFRFKFDQNSVKDAIRSFTGAH